MNPKEMLFELKPCDECSHSCVEGQFGVKCPYDLIVEPLLNKTKMKTKEEIEQLAAREYWRNNVESRSFIKGYTQCQEDMAKDVEYWQGEFEHWYKQAMDMSNKYNELLNKQD